jgi:hypothetical protein
MDDRASLEAVKIQERSTCYLWAVYGEVGVGEGLGYQANVEHCLVSNSRTFS